MIVLLVIQHVVDNILLAQDLLPRLRSLEHLLESSLLSLLLPAHIILIELLKALHFTFLALLELQLDLKLLLVGFFDVPSVYFAPVIQLVALLFFLFDAPHVKLTRLFFASIQAYFSSFALTFPDFKPSHELFNGSVNKLAEVCGGAEDDNSQTRVSDTELFFGLRPHIAEVHQMIHDDDKLNFIEHFHSSVERRFFCPDVRSSRSNDKTTYVQRRHL